MKPRLALLLATALGIGVLYASDDGDPVAEPVRTSEHADNAPMARHGAPKASAAASTAPAELLAVRARQVPDERDEARARLFAATSFAPPPPPPPAHVQAAPAAPVAPPLPFVVVGRQNLAGNDEVLLAQGDRLLGVRAGTVIDGRYRVESVDARMLTLVYLPLNQTQQLAIRASN
ncbi:MAG: hypothetical protein JO370_13490 [Paucibacter sp.]|nr:hypothetical protein [Roseateles sp.]